jgi:hypothetical protein
MKEIQIHPAPQPGPPDWCQSKYWCNHKTVRNKIMQQNSKRRMKKIIFTGILEWHFSLFSLQHTFSPSGIRMFWCKIC